MARLRLVLMAVFLSLALATPALAQPVPTVRVVRDPTLGNILVDARGMTLYRFTRDEPNMSNCYDACAQTWPPLLLPAGNPVAPPGLGGRLGIAVRRDGTRQVTYNGMPLYFYARDTRPGETNGQGVGGVWFVVEAIAAGPAQLPRTGGGALGLLLPVVLVVGLTGLGTGMLRCRTR